jgi:hypothetical protein
MISSAFLVTCLIAAASALCWDGSSPSAQPNLTICAEYAASACCTPTTEGLIAQQLAGFGSSLGNGNCKDNVRAFACAFACDPNGQNFVTPGNTLIGAFATYAVDALYNSCKDVCLDNGPISNIFPNKTSLLDAFHVPPNPPAPAVSFVESNATGAWNGTLRSPLPTENCYCWDGSAPLAYNLTLCTQYSRYGCCSPTTEHLLVNQLSTYGSLFGTANCATNVQQVGCGLLCSPRSGQFVSATTTLFKGNFTQTLATGLFDSCKGRCYDGSKTIAQSYTDANAFLASLNIPASPPLQPAVNFSISTSPAAFNTAMLSASSTDQQGCASTDSTESSGASAVVASVAVVVAAIMAAF